MKHENRLPVVLYRFDDKVNAAQFAKQFQSDFSLISVDNDQDALTQIEQSEIHALILDQAECNSSLPLQFKKHKADALVILLHEQIELDAIVALLEEGKIDKCFSRPFDANLIRSEIFTVFMGVKPTIETAKFSLDPISKPVVLLVDDEVVATKFLKKQLTRLDDSYTLLLADDAQQALALFNQYDDQIAVIISDQRMPGMQGNEFLREVRKRQPHVVRMLTSAYEEIDIALDCINDSKIFRYIKKPWDGQVINDLIRGGIEEYKARLLTMQNRQQDISALHAEILSQRIAHIRTGLKDTLQGLDYEEALELFLAALQGIKTLSPSNATVKASMNTDLELSLTSSFCEQLPRYLRDRIQNAQFRMSPDQVEALQALFTAADRQTMRFDFAKAPNLAVQYQILLHLFLELLEATRHEACSFRLLQQEQRICLSNRDGQGIVMFKHLLSPLAQFTPTMITQQCALFAFIFMCQRCGVSVHIEGAEHMFKLSFQLPVLGELSYVD